MIGIVRGFTMAEVLLVATCFSEAGLTTLEVTMNTHDVSLIINRLRRDFPELNIGAGTVCSMKDLTLALESGAQFVVTPILNPEVVHKCVQEGIPVFPGALTPTEIYQAWSLGASAVKVFPAAQLGPRYIKDVLAPLDEIKLVPTGGVNLQNIRSYFEAGAIAVGMGGSLINKEEVVDRNEDQMHLRIRRLLEEIEHFRKG
jgi:2-dehydro-3-deoxyphosphogluconate aldolase/(4S)-4-hydroxy-2-oxoglutarate aldolase